MPKAIIIVLLTLTAHLSSAREWILSSSAEIRVMTLGAYQPELYSVFGHSAFRIKDPVNNIDDVYNYGVFDFDQPNFYLNFFKGTPYYRLGVSDYKRFKRIYIYYDRSIYEQTLNLDSLERQKLYDFLLKNDRPENRNYVYNYFNDNCATKILDVLEEVFGSENIILDRSFVDGSSIRDLMNDRMDLQPWGYLAFNIFLSGIEKPATAKQYLYLPEYIHLALKESKIKTEDGVKPLIKSEKVVYESRGIVPFEAPLITPAWVMAFIFLLTITITLWDYKRRGRSRYFDFILFLIVGFLGALFLYLWFFTSHISQYNWNLLWAWPTHLVLAFSLIKKKTTGGIRKYFYFSALVSALTATLFWLIPQGIPWYMIFIMLSMATRGVYIGRFRGRKY